MESDKNDEMPQRPSWTLFFEGTLYQKYLQYMKNHDLSKVLNNGSTITNKNNPVLDPPVLNNETNWLPVDGSKLESEAGYPDYNYPPSYTTYPPDSRNNYENGSPPPYNYTGRQVSTTSDKFLSPSERKRRKRQTRGFICLGIMILGAIAAASALIIHYVVITKKEQVYDGGTIHIPSQNSSSIFNKTLEQLTKDHIIFGEDGEVSPIEEILQGSMENLLPTDIEFGSNKTTSDIDLNMDPDIILMAGDEITNGMQTTVVVEDIMPTRSTQIIATEAVTKTEAGTTTEAGLVTEAGITTEAGGVTEAEITTEAGGVTEAEITTGSDIITEAPVLSETTIPTEGESPTTSDTPTTTSVDTSVTTVAPTTNRTEETTAESPPKKIAFSNDTLEIGKPGEIHCRLNGIRMWDSAYIRGRKLPLGRESPLTLTVMMDGSVCMRGNDTRITTSQSVTKDKKDRRLSNVDMKILISEVQCIDADSFYCGINGQEKEFQEAVFSVSSAPEPRPTLTIPTGIFENSEVFITAKWKAGFPKEIGTLSWSKVDPGETEVKPINDSSITLYNIQEIPEKCQVEVTTRISFVPTLDWNRTKIIVTPSLKENEVATVEQIDGKILVLPETVCDGQTTDVKINHPYTCERFIRCRPMESPVVYSCPDKACFDSGKGECV